MIWYISKYDDKLVHIRLATDDEGVPDSDKSIYVEREKLFFVLEMLDDIYCCDMGETVHFEID